MGQSVVITGPTLRQRAERGDDISDVLLRYTPGWAQSATQSLYSAVGKLDEIERDRVYEFAGFTSFEDYVERGLGQGMWWVEGAREIVAKHHAMKYGEGVTVAEADKEIRSKREEIEERRAKAKALREEGKTQQEIAVELGVSQPTVHADLSEKSVITEKTDRPPRKWIQYTIRNTTKPETAARRIREVFGDDFADELRHAL